LDDAVFHRAPLAVSGCVIGEFSQAVVVHYAALTHSGCVTEELLGGTFFHCVALTLFHHCL